MPSAWRDIIIMPSAWRDIIDPVRMFAPLPAATACRSRHGETSSTRSRTSVRMPARCPAAPAAPHTY
eukprot:361655-Chlamydomonas_euryale.AAC.6